MKRRTVLALTGGAAAFPRIALAQQAVKLPRVALVDPAVAVTDMTATGALQWAAFIQELARRGYVEGTTILYERYLAPPTIAADTARFLVGSAPDVVFAAGATIHTLAIQALSSTLPVVLVGSNLVGQGVVTNLAHPGGNVTGISQLAGPEAEAKNLELLVQAVPGAKRVTYYATGVGGQVLDVLQGDVVGVRAAAQTLGLGSTVVVVENPADEAEYRRAFAEALATRPDIIQFGRGSAIIAGSAILAKLALDTRIPAISLFAPFAQAGGLLSYGSNNQDNYGKAAGYVALILQGAKPGDLPVLLPTTFDFLVNMKTAKTFGLTLPPSVLLQATQVIA